MIDGIRFVDALCRVGLPCVKQAGGAYTAEALTAEMDRIGVDAAMVHHVRAQEVSSDEGNRELEAETGGSVRLLPLWVALPPATDEIDPPGVWCEAMERHGVRAVTLFPGDGWNTHGYRLRPGVVRGLFDELERRRIPVLLNFSASGFTVGELAGVAQAYPRLPLIIARYPATAMRELVPVLRDAPSLYLETSLFQVNGGIEWICGRLGPERLIFGSNMPVSSLGAAVAPVLLADIPRASKALIASGNLERLLSIAPGSGVPRGSARDRPSARPSFPVVDGHGHIGPWAPAWIAESDIDSIIRRMDRLNVEALCATSAWSLSGDNRSGNDFLAAQSARHPGRIIAYATANPNDPSPEEIRRCFDRLGMRLIKVHPGFHQCPLGSPRWDEVWRFAEERHSVVLIHTVGSQEDCDAATRIARTHPGLRLLMAHAGNSFANAERYLACAAACPNISIEITFSACLDGIIEHLVEGAPDRIVYGSDMAWRSPEAQYGWAVHARIPDARRRMLMRDNMLSLLSYAGVPR